MRTALVGCVAMGVIAVGLLGTPRATAEEINWTESRAQIHVAVMDGGLLTGAAAVVGIVGGIAGYVNDADAKRRIAEMNGKLDIIMAKQELILSEIQALRVYFNEALRASFRQEATIDFVALKDRYEVALAAKSVREERKGLEKIRGEAERVAFRMKEYGPASYQTAFSAAYVLGMTNYRLRIDPDQRRKSMATMSARFSRWLEPSGEESVPAIRDRAFAEQTRFETYIDAFPRVHDYVFGNVKDGMCYFDEHRVVTISGDRQTGFTASHTEYRKKIRCGGRGEDSDCRKCLRPADIASALAPYAESLSRAQVRPEPVTLTPYPPLDQINLLRGRWRAQVEEVARIDLVIKNIGEARTAIDRMGNMR